jgi:D-glycero-D-manno-heptose 1,7-bisphosphate phosphatase
MNSREDLRPLVLLDRDGTINVEVNYLSRPEQVELIPGVAEGLLRLQVAGFPLAVVSNQSGVARGYFTEDDLAAIHRRLEELLGAESIALAGIYYCPHHPEAGCDCRKPSPGLALQAAAALSGDLSRSFVIGDKACDIELGRNVGARTVLVRTGWGSHYDFLKSPAPDAVVNNLNEAALWILKQKS